MAILGAERCLLFVSYFDSKTVVSILKVDFAKILSSSYPVYNLSN